MDDAFEFDAPHYADLTSPEKYDYECEDMSYFSQGNSTSDSEISKKSTTSGARMPKHYVASDEVPCLNIINEASSLNVMKVNNLDTKSNVRQSPRLAAIANCILSKRQTKLGGCSTRKRSLSEGEVIPSNLTKVNKTSVKRSARTNPKLKFNKDDMKSFEAISKSLQTTKPKEFHFATDSRIKTHTSNDDLVMDFARTLRSNNCLKNNNNLKEFPKGPTKVKAFHLHLSKKPKEESKPFVSMAELNMKFESKTPLRFRTKRVAPVATMEEWAKKPCGEAGVTIPHTPKLSTRLRSRPATQYPTIEEIEEKELEEAQKLKFKALPLNKKIFEQPKIDLKEKKKTATVPQPFDITDLKKQTNDDIGKKLIAACHGMNDSTWSLTSIPHGGITAKWDKKSTLVKPFSFDSRDMEALERKKKNIQKLIEEEKKLAEFHAQLMPEFDKGTSGLPEKKIQSPTKIRPFNLRSDIRGFSKQEQLQKQLAEIESIEEEQRKFHAQPDSVVHKEPFIPAKSKKPLTDISGFSLNTKKRAEERFAFDAHLKQKGDELMAKKKEIEEMHKEDEEAEIARLRKEVVHKAKPVPNYKPFQVKTGLVPPTLPVTPEFQTDKRIRTRTSSKQNLNISSFANNGTYSMEQ